jgi:hypothetical protein
LQVMDVRPPVGSGTLFYKSDNGKFVWILGTGTAKPPSQVVDDEEATAEVVVEGDSKRSRVAGPRLASRSSSSSAPP